MMNPFKSMLRVRPLDGDVSGANAQATATPRHSNPNPARCVAGRQAHLTLTLTLIAWQDAKRKADGFYSVSSEDTAKMQQANPPKVRGPHARDSHETPAPANDPDGLGVGRLTPYGRRRRRQPRRPRRRPKKPGWKRTNGPFVCADPCALPSCEEEYTNQWYDDKNQETVI